MSNQFNSPEGDLENYFVSEYWLIDQYIGDQLWIWGISEQLGIGVTGNTLISTPVTTFAGGTNWKQVSCGNNFAAAIKTDGTLWTWGSNSAGQLGNASITTVSTPVTTFSGGTNWKQISCGNNHTAATKIDGTLWTWGTNNYGQLGNASVTNVSTPVTTFAGGTNWKQISASNGFTAAIKTDGTLWTWGNSNFGQLGNLLLFEKSTPVTTFAGGTNWKQVAAGSFHTAAIKTDGTLWIWGNGSDGRLGNTVTTGSIRTPVTTFAGGNNWKQVSCGKQSTAHTAAIKTDGTLWTWGSGLNGRLGNSQFLIRSTPVTTFAGGTNWKQVSCGEDHTAATKIDGTLWTWGANGGGHLGNASITDVSTPVTTFAGGTNWKQLSAGFDLTIAVQSGINAEYPLS